MRVHRISSEVLLDLGYSSKLNAEWDFLVYLRDEGRRSAERFIQAHGHEIGRRSTLDIENVLRHGAY
jgi:NTE family protein